MSYKILDFGFPTICICVMALFCRLLFTITVIRHRFDCCGLTAQTE